MDFQTENLLYGGDYNPDQWLHSPEILEQDLILMKEAGINCVTMGMFSWAKLEPEDGRYEFDWLEEIIDKLYANGISTILGTPSGARPRWLAEKYPEVLRVDKNRVRQLFGNRHNHCMTSPVYRRKVREMNQALVHRFDANPGVILWHLSNEYGGECHCPLCQDAFREWMKKRYQDISRVNHSWNCGFWSHDYDNFSQVESPSPVGEGALQGLDLAWRRFVSDQTIDFAQAEIDAIREAGGTKPITTNLMYEFRDINYYHLAKHLDVVSWDNYPAWGKGNDAKVALDNAMQHDYMRSLKKKPFLLMESCPGATNWQPVSKLKRPGVLAAASLQAIAHGSDSVQYFQIRKGQAGVEKFHGAVIDHYGKADDRTYQECRQLGLDLQTLSELAGSQANASVAVIWDVENRWALENSQGPRNSGIFYQEAVKKSYTAFRQLGLTVDVITEEQDLSSYKIVAAPFLYLFQPGFAARVREFVANGGSFILTYYSGVVNEEDLCFLGGTPGGLMDVFGLRSTEIDGLYDWDYNEMAECVEAASDSKGECGNKSIRGMHFPKGKVYRAEHLCQLVSLKGAKALMTYQRDFYAGTPALTVNEYGKGRAYYVCADAEQEFYNDFYRLLVEEAEQEVTLCPVSGQIPYGIEVSARETAKAHYIFVQNFTGKEVNDWQPDIPGGQLIFGEYETMGADGLPVYHESRKGSFQPFETRIYRVDRGNAG